MRRPQGGLFDFRTVAVLLLCAAPVAMPWPCLAAEPVRAELEPPPPPPDRALSLASRTLTGDWEGQRQRLEKKGITLNLYVNDQVQAVLRDGLQNPWRGPPRGVDGCVRHVRPGKARAHAAG